MKKFLALLVILAVSLLGVSAFAYDVKVSDETFGKVGFKSQIWYQYLQAGAPNGTSSSNDFAIKQVRIYTSGQMTNLVKFGANVDFGKGTTDGQVTAPNAGTAGITDGYITLDFAKEAKLMVGIYRMAVSRVALQDSYTYMTIHAPAVAGVKYLSNQNNFRDAGATVWGDLVNGMIRYNVSMWDGSYTPTTAVPAVNTLATVNPADKPTYSARVAINLWDPEPGYTNSCCYLGKAKILSFGAGYLNQQYINGSFRHYTVKTVDAYLALDPITAEAGYFEYDYNTFSGGSKPKGWYGQASFKLGQIEPALRYESWDANNSATKYDYQRYVVGLNYYVKGHDAKISLERLANKSHSPLGTIDRLNPDNSRNFADWTLQLETQF